MSKLPTGDGDPGNLPEDHKMNGVFSPSGSMLAMSWGALAKWSLAALIPLAIIGLFLYWIATGFNKITQSIFGAQSSVSRSMEPYELMFRTLYRGSRWLAKNERPYEWKLAVPRAFVVTEIGARDTIRGLDEKKDFYSVFIDAVLDSTSLSLEPAVTASKVQLLDRFIGLNIINGGTDLELTGDVNCVRADDYRQFMESRGGFTVTPPCSKLTPRCSIYTHFEGWYVDIGVSRALYGEPQKICAVVRSFLKKYTQKVDNLIPQKN